MRQVRGRHLTATLTLAGLLPVLIGCSTTPEAVQDAQVSFTPELSGMSIKVTNPGPGVMRLGGDMRFGPVSVEVRISDEAVQAFYPRANPGDPWWNPEKLISSYIPRTRPIVLGPGNSLYVAVYARELSASMRPDGDLKGKTCRFQFRATVQYQDGRRPSAQGESEWATSPCIVLFPPAS